MNVSKMGITGQAISVVLGFALFVPSTLAQTEIQPHAMPQIGQVGRQFIQS